MPVGYRSSSVSGASDSQGTSRSVPVPSGAAAGDIALLAIEMWWDSGTDPTVTWPSGFTQIVNITLTGSGPARLKVAWKRLTGSDAGNYTMSWTGTQWNMAHCILMTGAVAAGDPIEATNTATTAGATATPSTTVTPVTAAGLVHFVSRENSATGTAPTNFTEVQDGDYITTSYRLPGAGGTYVASGGSLSTSTLQLVALIAIKADAEGGPTTHDLTASGSGTATGSAALLLRMASSAAGSGTPGGSGALALLIPISGSGSGTSTGSAALSSRLTLSANGTSTAGGTADLTLSGAGPTTHQLTATGSGTAGGAAVLRLALTASATGAATSSGTAALTARLILSAAASATSIGTAYLTALWLLTATGSATSGGSAALEIVGPLPPITERPFEGSTTRPTGAPLVTLRPDAGVTPRP